MPEPALIVLAGQIGAGKTTAARFLGQNYAITHKSFVDTFWVPVLRERGLATTRHNLQVLGVELLEKRGPNGLVDDMLALLDPDLAYIIDDVRSPSVFEYLKSRAPKASLVFLTTSFDARFPRLQERDGVETEQQQRVAEEAPTETEIDDLKPFASFVIGNDGDLDTFHGELAKIATALGLSRR